MVGESVGGGSPPRLPLMKEAWSFTAEEGKEAEPPLPNADHGAALAAPEIVILYEKLAVSET